MPAGPFRFVQLEVPWPLGPEDGRYVVRRHAGEQPDHVLVLATLGAPQRRLLRGRSPKNAEPEPEPTPVPTGRATVIPTTPFETVDEADRWLGVVDQEIQVAEAIVVLNRALHAHRLATADTSSREVARADAIVVRLGYGAGEQVAEGRWKEARELPASRAPRLKRQAALRPQERLAALLGGRDAALACELLVLRTRADIDAGREREAALQLRGALDAALAELVAWRERGDLAARLDELADEHERVAAIATTALQHGLDPDDSADVARILGRIEAALRARSAAGFT